MTDRCTGTRTDGEGCQAFPVEGSTYCVAHQDQAGDETAETEPDASNRCGAPTQRGGLCRNPPMAGADRCHLHVGLEPTHDQRRAQVEGGTKHGYFVQGFLDEDEKEHFRQVVEGTRELGELKRHVVAALVVRANRIMRWEAEGQQVSGFTTEVFGELRKSLEAMTADELKVDHSWDIAEVADQVEAVLAQDPQLLLRVVPDAAREAVREALEDA
jgi:hypothetical protein